MKAIITAGGRGARIRPLSKSRNKHLLPVAGKPVLFYALDAIAGAGITQVCIAINPGDEEVKRLIDSGGKFGVNVSYIKAGPSLPMPEIMRRSKDFVGKEPFVFYLGDNLFQEGIRRFVNDFVAKGEPDCYLVLTKADHLEQYGVAEIDNGQIFRITEKPQEPQSDNAVAVTGMSIYTPQIFEAIQQIEASRFSKMSISDMHLLLINKGFRVEYSLVAGWWKDVGTPKDFLIADRLLRGELGGQQWHTSGSVSASPQRGKSVLDGLVVSG